METKNKVQKKIECTINTMSKFKVIFFLPNKYESVKF